MAMLINLRVYSNTKLPNPHRDLHEIPEKSQRPQGDATPEMGYTPINCRYIT